MRCTLIWHWEFHAALVLQRMDLSIPVHLIHNQMPTMYSLVSTKGTQFGFNLVSIYAEVTSIHLSITQLGVLSKLPYRHQHYSLCKQIVLVWGFLFVLVFGWSLVLGFFWSVVLFFGFGGLFFFFFNQNQSTSLEFIDFKPGKFRPKSQRQENEVLNDWVAQPE